VAAVLVAVLASLAPPVPTGWGAVVGVAFILGFLILFVLRVRSNRRHRRRESKVSKDIVSP
jgi:hypothetical protein